MHFLTPIVGGGVKSKNMASVTPKARELGETMRQMTGHKAYLYSLH